MSKNRGKQAVVIIHGMGEQRPMETIRSFVKTVWEEDPDIAEDQDPKLWSKPTKLGQSFEQRRLTTNNSRENADGYKRRTDFFEYYWAHHTVDTRWEHFKGWFLSLLLRRPSSYPKRIRPVWWLLFIVTVLVLLAGLDVFAPDVSCNPAKEEQLNGWCNIGENWDYLVAGEAPIDERLITTVAKIPGMAWGFLTNFWLQILAVLSTWLVSKIVLYFGDVARYVRANPANIKVRQAIRSDGIKMLEEICRSSRNYDRVIVVAHSLGTIVGYDILAHLWARHCNLPDKLLEDAEGRSIVAEMEAMASKSLWDVSDQQCYRVLQKKLFTKLKDYNDDNGMRWLISDFVTLGAALTHSEFLTSQTAEEFLRKKKDRESPTSPPVVEWSENEKQGKFTYFTSDNDGNRQEHMHHATLFAPVRWTNIYDDHQFILLGDLISGPLAKAFASPEMEEKSETPVIDIDAKIKRDNSFLGRLFTHTEYWKWRNSYQDLDALPYHIEALRKATNLIDEDTWGGVE